MKRQDFCSQVLLKSVGTHREKALVILNNSAIMENQEMHIEWRGHRPISLEDPFSWEKANVERKKIEIAEKLTRLCYVWVLI